MNSPIATAARKTCCGLDSVGPAVVTVKFGRLSVSSASGMMTPR